MLPTSTALDIQRDLAGLALELDLELQRPVLAHTLIHQEEDERALVGPLCAAVPGAGMSAPPASSPPSGTANGV